MFHGRRLFKAVIFFILGDIIALLCPSIVFYICFISAITLFGVVAFSRLNKYKYMQKYFAFFAFGLVLGALFSSFVLSSFRVYEGSQTKIKGYVTEVNTINETITISVKEEKLFPFRFNAKLYSDEKFISSLKKGDGVEVVVDCGKVSNNIYLLADRCYIQGNIVELSKCDVDIGFFDSLFISVRAAIEDSLTNALGKTDERALAISILVGDQTGISEGLKTAFKVTGTSHYLSISGLHFSLIVLLTYFVVMRTTENYKAACIISIIVIFLYMPIPSFTPPVIRSAFISIFLFVTKLLKLKSDTVTSMSLSLFIIMLFNPAAILSVGLQLSYIATFGIIYSDIVTPELSLENRHGSVMQRFSRYVQLSFKVSTLALIFTTPIVILTFGEFSLFSPLFNIILSPLFSIVLVCSIIIAFISFIFPILSLYIVWFFELPIKIYNKLIELFGNVPSILIHTDGTFTKILTYLLAFAVFIAILTHKKKRENDGKIFLFLVWGSVIIASLLGF